MKRKSNCCNCRRLVTHCSAAIIHSTGFVTKLLLVNTLIILCRSHARIVTQLFAMCTLARHACTPHGQQCRQKESNNFTFRFSHSRKTKGLRLTFSTSIFLRRTRDYTYIHRTKLSTTLRSTLTRTRRKGTNMISETICPSAKINRI